MTVDISTQRYSIRKAAWFWFFIVSLFIAPQIIILLTLSGDPRILLFSFLVAGGSLLFLSLFFPNYVELRRDRLLIRLGILRITLPYEKIDSVWIPESIFSKETMFIPCLNITASFRVVFIRMNSWVRFGWLSCYKLVRISPQDREEFVEDLSSRILLFKDHSV